MSATWIAAIAACLSAVATLAAVATAVAAYRLQSNIARGQKERLKNEALLRSIQSLVVDFADIHATAKESSSDKRSERLEELAEKFNHTATMVRSLDTDVGKKIGLWQDSTDRNGNSVVGIFSYDLGFLGITLSPEYDNYLSIKASALREIRDSVFSDGRA